MIINQCFIIGFALSHLICFRHSCHTMSWYELILDKYYYLSKGHSGLQTMKEFYDTVGVASRKVTAYAKKFQFQELKINKSCAIFDKHVK